MSEEILLPQTREESVEIVRSCLAEESKLYVCGNNSRYKAEGVKTMSTKNLNKTIFFEPDDMVVGVEAGMSVNDLNALLSKENMYLPVNPFFGESTVGSIVACNDTGGSKLFMGGIRDNIIGISYINGKGHSVKAGGKVVKNVTGYDISKMLTGSKGYFGAIQTVNFKIVPKPIGREFLVFEFHKPDFSEFLIELNSKFVPVSFLQIQKVRKNEPYKICVGFEGNEARRDRIRNDINSIFRKDGMQVSDEADLPSGEIFSNYLGSFKSKAGIADDRKGIRVFASTEKFCSSSFFETVEKIDSPWLIHPFGGDAFVFLSEELGETQNTVDALYTYFPLESSMFDFYDPDCNLRKTHARKDRDDIELAKHLKSVTDPLNIFYSPQFN